MDTPHTENQALSLLLQRFGQISERLSHMAGTIQQLEERMRDMAKLAPRLTAEMMLLAGMPRIFGSGMYYMLRNHGGRGGRGGGGPSTIIINHPGGPGGGNSGGGGGGPGPLPNNPATEAQKHGSRPANEAVREAVKQGITDAHDQLSTGPSPAAPPAVQQAIANEQQVDSRARLASEAQRALRKLPGMRYYAGLIKTINIHAQEIAHHPEARGSINPRKPGVVALYDKAFAQSNRSLQMMSLVGTLAHEAAHLHQHKSGDTRPKNVRELEAYLKGLQARHFFAQKFGKGTASWEDVINKNLPGIIAHVEKQHGELPESNAYKQRLAALGTRSKIPVPSASAPAAPDPAEVKKKQAEEIEKHLEAAGQLAHTASGEQDRYRKSEILQAGNEQLGLAGALSAQHGHPFKKFKGGLAAQVNQAWKFVAKHFRAMLLAGAIGAGSLFGSGGSAHAAAPSSAPQVRQVAEAAHHVVEDIVERVIDGDTVVLKKLGSSRLHGINAPETAHKLGEQTQPFGAEAHNYLQGMLRPGQRVRATVKKASDIYNRPVVQLHNEQGEDINRAMLQAGMAYHDDLGSTHRRDWQEYEADARGAERKGRGLWQQPAHERYSPHAWYKMQQAHQYPAYIPPGTVPARPASSSTPQAPTSSLSAGMPAAGSGFGNWLLGLLAGGGSILGSWIGLRRRKKSPAAAPVTQQAATVTGGWGGDIGEPSVLPDLGFEGAAKPVLKEVLPTQPATAVAQVIHPVKQALQKQNKASYYRRKLIEKHKELKELVDTLPPGFDRSAEQVLEVNFLNKEINELGKNYTKAQRRQNRTAALRSKLQDIKKQLHAVKEEGGLFPSPFQRRVKSELEQEARKVGKRYKASRRLEEALLPGEQDNAEEREEFTRKVLEARKPSRFKKKPVPPDWRTGSPEPEGSWFDHTTGQFSGGQGPPRPPQAPGAAGPEDEQPNQAHRDWKAQGFDVALQKHTEQLTKSNKILAKNNTLRNWLLARETESFEEYQPGHPDADAWGMVRGRRETGRGSRWERFQSAAPAAFLVGSSVAAGLTKAASPEAFDLLTGSARMLAARLGQMLIPAVVRVSHWFQVASDWVANLSEPIKNLIGWLTQWGLVLLGSITILNKLGVLGLIGTSLGKLAGWLGITKAALAGFGTRLASLAFMNPLVAAGTALAGIIGWIAHELGNHADYIEKNIKDESDRSRFEAKAPKEAAKDVEQLRFLQGDKREEFIHQKAMEASNRLKAAIKDEEKYGARVRESPIGAWLGDDMYQHKKKMEKREKAQKLFDFWNQEDKGGAAARFGPDWKNMRNRKLQSLHGMIMPMLGRSQAQFTSIGELSKQMQVEALNKSPMEQFFEDLHAQDVKAMIKEIMEINKKSGEQNTKIDDMIKRMSGLVNIN